MTLAVFVIERRPSFATLLAPFFVCEAADSSIRSFFQEVTHMPSGFAARRQFGGFLCVASLSSWVFLLAGCADEGANKQARVADAAASAAPSRGALAALAPAGAPAERGTPEAVVHNTEAYDRIVDNPFVRVANQPLSTFSIDVDTASYANVRRFLRQGMLPPKDAVRIEELINYFSYNYEPPTGDEPFSVNVEIARCPWNSEHRLARIGLKGKEIRQEKRPAANLVFLLDVSGSMNEPAKLPLLKSAMRLLVEKLGENDRVAIVVYAGAEGLALKSTSCTHKGEIVSALEQLQAGGSTNGGAGITLAYQVAVQNFIPEGTNRVILCTDGDFNVGVTNQGDLTRLIEQKAKSKVFLSVLGFGEGDLKDSTMEKLADLGNGNYAYIDTLQEARKVLVEQMSGTLIAIAKDVKIQVEFNPAKVGAYRLIGYENRMLAAQDFNNDEKDAGEIGAGHTVTALYELIPPGKDGDVPSVDQLKYSTTGESALVPTSSASPECFTVKLRYKAPEGEVSQKLERGVVDYSQDYARATPDFKFAAAVAAFGMLLRDSAHRGTATYESVLELAQAARGADPSGYRAEFIELAGAARSLSANRGASAR
jgi:Ca-activated chloride channel family protein